MLSVDDISLSFGGVKALSHVSFDIREGEVRAIIGPNGAGKSSMLNVINGFYHPDSGSDHLQGKDPQGNAAGQAARQGIARTFQNIALFHGMSTLDNIMTGRNTKMHRNFLWQALHVGPARREELEHREKVEEIIDFLEIQAIRKTPVGRLPYGLQKRVELGRALAAEPDLLLLDEPMAGMNSEEKEDMCRFVLDVNEEFGTTIALIEHDMSVVMDISDRVRRARLWRQDRRRHPRYGPQQPACDRRLSRRQPRRRTERGPMEFLTPSSITPFVEIADSPVFFAEVAINGLLTGVMYSLVALGFVLIFKASGVFNFAQGIMVLFAALTLVGLMEHGLPVWLAMILTIGVMIALAFAIERLMLRHLVNQEEIILFMATIGLAFFLEGFGETLWGSNVKRLDVGIPDMPLEFGGILLSSFDLIAALIGAVMVAGLAISSRKPRSGGRCARSPTTIRRPCRSASP